MPNLHVHKQTTYTDYLPHLKGVVHLKTPSSGQDNHQDPMVLVPSWHEDEAALDKPPLGNWVPVELCTHVVLVDGAPAINRKME